MTILRGTTANLVDPQIRVGLLFFVGTGVALQVFWALNVALRRDQNSN